MLAPVLDCKYIKEFLKIMFRLHLYKVIFEKYSVCVSIFVFIHPLADFQWKVLEQCTFTVKFSSRRKFRIRWNSLDFSILIWHEVSLCIMKIMLKITIIKYKNYKKYVL